MVRRARQNRRDLTSRSDSLPRSYTRRLAFIALCSLLAASCAEKGELAGPGDRCWYCTVAHEPDPSVSFETTPEEAAASVLGVWQGEYSGDPFDDPLTVRITITDSAEGKPEYTVPPATVAEGCNLPSTAGEHCAEIGWFTSPAAVEVVANLPDMSLTATGVKMRGTALRQAPLSTAEINEGDAPLGVVFVDDDPVRELWDLTYLFMFDGTLWARVGNLPGFQPYRQIGARQGAP
jgi:hypothetical protein